MKNNTGSFESVFSRYLDTEINDNNVVDFIIDLLEELKKNHELKKRTRLILYQTKDGKKIMNLVFKENLKKEKKSKATEPAIESAMISIDLTKYDLFLKKSDGREKSLQEVINEIIKSLKSDSYAYEKITFYLKKEKEILPSAWIFSLENQFLMLAVFDEKNEEKELVRWVMKKVIEKYRFSFNPNFKGEWPVSFYFLSAKNLEEAEKEALKRLEDAFFERFFVENSP